MLRRGLAYGLLGSSFLWGAILWAILSLGAALVVTGGILALALVVAVV